jgi:neurofibromin 1
VALTKATLLSISNTSIDAVADALLVLLEELSRPYKTITAHPPHVLYSELYILQLLADCCSAHWQNVDFAESGTSVDDERGSSSPSSHSERATKRTQSLDEKDTNARGIGGFRYSRQHMSALPRSLDDTLIGRMLEAVKKFMNPIAEAYTLPASTILDDGASISSHVYPNTLSDSSSSGSGQIAAKNAAKLLEEKSEDIELFSRAIMEFISASNWVYVLEHLKSTLRGLRSTHPSQGLGSQTGIAVDEDRMALATLQLASCFWVDGRKLGQVIQEFCGSFLHLRKPFQYTLAIVVPLLITRWLDQNPEEFVQLHVEHKRLDGGADTLFDMTNTMVDSGKWKAALYPFQNALLFLLPDVFQVASNMRDAKSSSMIKKVAFLEGLRKALRNRNPTAAYCLISLLRVARHFRLDSDAALLSYALDVQDEVREAVFRKFALGIDSTVFGDNLMTAAFVSLAYLNFETCHQNLAPICLSANAPQDFKVAYISACCYFARQANVENYQPLFSKASTLIRSHLKVGKATPRAMSLIDASRDFLMTAKDYVLAINTRCSRLRKFYRQQT